MSEGIFAAVDAVAERVGQVDKLAFPKPIRRQFVALGNQISNASVLRDSDLAVTAAQLVLSTAISVASTQPVRKAHPEMLPYVVKVAGNHI